MKRTTTLVLAFAVALWGANAFAQGHGKGKPDSTGLQHAEATANPHGDKGIENAEAKQTEHKKTKKSKKHKKSTKKNAAVSTGK